jgi:hypothetical protein
MRTLIPGIALASTLAAACGSGPRTADAFFVGADAGPPDAPFSDAFRPAIDAFMPMGTDSGAMMGTDSGAMMGIDSGAMMGMDSGPMIGTDSGPPAPDAFASSDANLMPPANDTCATATMIGVGTFTGTTLGAVNDYGDGTMCANADGGDVVYAIDVPAGNVLSVSVTTSDGTFDPSISLVDASCGGTPRVCLDGDDTGLASAVNVAEYNNTTGATVRILAVVDTYDDATLGGEFDLTASLTAPSSNDTCATATPVSSGASIDGNTLGASNDYTSGTNCSGTSGPDVVYALDVPAGQRATVTVRGTGSFDPSINLLAGPAATCGGTPFDCIDGDDSGSASTTNTVVWTNETGSDTTVYAVVDSASTGTGPFRFTANVAMPGVGETCASAQRIMAGTFSDSLAGYVNDYGSGTLCSGAGGVDRVYVVSVGAGQTLSADVASGDGSFDPSINLELACGATPRVCVDGDDSGGASTTNSVAYTNAGAAAVDVHVVVETFSTTSSGGPFTLTVALTP